MGGLAQLGEHLLCKQGVVGSIPSSSTKFRVVRCKPKYPGSARGRCLGFLVCCRKTCCCSLKIQRVELGLSAENVADVSVQADLA